MENKINKNLSHKQGKNTKKQVLALLRIASKDKQNADLYHYVADLVGAKASDY